MRIATGGEKLAAIFHCVELALSADASGRILLDGTTGLRADAKQSTYLDPDKLDAKGESLDALFEPREFLTPRELQE
jgi:hypothetical protein